MKSSRQQEIAAQFTEITESLEVELERLKKLKRKLDDQIEAVEGTLGHLENAGHCLLDIQPEPEQ